MVAKLPSRPRQEGRVKHRPEWTEHIARRFAGEAPVKTTPDYLSFGKAEIFVSPAKLKSKTRKREYPESVMQREFIAWTRFQITKSKFEGIELTYAIPNAGKMTLQAGQRARSEGLTAGVPDVCVPVPKSGYGALYIEFKAGKAGLNEAQQDYQPRLADYNAVAICRSCEDAISVVKYYYSLTNSDEIQNP
jgi:hypothetical protein